MPSPRICVVGASNIDLISYVPRLPTMGETLHGTQFAIGFGGKGANQAVMAAKLGGEVSVVTQLGKDVFGEDTLRNFEKWGVDTSHIRFTTEAFSGVAPIAVDPHGNNAIIIVGGANDLMTVSEIRDARPAIARAQVLVCQLEIPLPLTLEALRLAREEGVTTILNPAPAPAELPQELYELSDIFCPNENESEALTDRSVRTIEEAERAGQIMLARGARSVILTLGERGSLLVEEDGATHVPAVEVSAIDTTGAGDAFVGSLAYFVAQGRTLTDAMRRANHIAAISTQGRGTQSSFPQASELPEDIRA